MLDMALLKIVSDRVALDLEDRRDFFSKKVAQIKEEMNYKGVLHSSIAMNLLTDAVGEELRIRCSTIWQIIARTLTAKGIQMDVETGGSIKKRLARLLDENSPDIPLVHNKTQELVGNVTAVQPLDNLKKGALARTGSEIDIAVLSHLNQQSTGVSGITIQGLGIVQTGAGSTASIAVTLGEAERRQVSEALAATEEALTASGSVNVADQEAARELISDIRTEMQRDNPNSLRIRGALQGLATAVQTLSAAPDAYNFLKGIASLFGLQLP